MQFHYLDASRQTCGPCSREELQRLFETGDIHAETPVRPATGGDWGPFRQLLETATSVPRPDVPPPLTGVTPPSHPSVGDDLRALKRHILVPWNEVREMRWLDNRRLIGVAAIGLFPLLIIALFTNAGNIRGAYWAMAFYFSALWAVFFYYVFPAPGVTLRNCLICFFGTGLFSVSLLQIIHFGLARSVTVFVDPGAVGENQSALEHLLLHRFIPTRWAAWILLVGLPEEVCKILTLVYLARNNAPFQPQTMMYYGLMAGLGFGIYEGVAYQERANLELGGYYLGNYYILNVVRLTALPFVHAIWTAIAGYFIGFAYQFPERKRGLLIIAVALPAFLHGTYNAVTVVSVLASLGVALISVFALNLYLAKSRDFERVLRGR